MHLPTPSSLPPATSATRSAEGAVTYEPALPTPTARRLAAVPAGQRPCPRNVAWVCATNGQDYANACVAENAGATPACEGRCPCAVAAQGGADVQPNALLPPAPAEKPTEPFACPAILDPVCGADGRGYSNSCMAAAGGTEVACKGNCPCMGGGGSGTGGGTEPPAACIDTFDPVCGMGEGGAACRLAGTGAECLHQLLQGGA